MYIHSLPSAHSPSSVLVSYLLPSFLILILLRADFSFSSALARRRSKDIIKIFIYMQLFSFVCVLFLSILRNLFQIFSPLPIIYFPFVYQN